MVNPNADRSLTITTAHFGPVEVQREQLLYCSAGLPPFHDLHLYVLLSKEEEYPFLWLQSVEQQALALVVAPYEMVVGQPAPDLSPLTRDLLGLQEEEQPEVYVIICLAPEPQESTMNLLAPLYICNGTGQARQVILEGEVALTRVPLLQNLEVA